MTVRSIFEFKFHITDQEEGIGLAKAIGNDMPPLDGYLGHEIIRDVQDAGHLIVSTQWITAEKANAVLSTYRDDEKLKRARELLHGEPNGFIGEIMVGLN